MNLLFVSCLYTEAIEQEAKRNGYGIQAAPNTYQWAVVQGLHENHANYEVVSFPAFGCYPMHFYRKDIPCDTIVYDGHEIGRSVGYSTLPVVKGYSICRSLHKYVKDWIKRKDLKRNDAFAVLIYQPESNFVDAVIPFKKKYPNMVIATIVTDMVDDFSNFAGNNTLLKRIQLGIETKKVKNNYKYIDKYVLLSKYMIERIPEAEDRSIVIEGIFNSIIDTTSKDYNPYTILYTGTLQEFGGVRQLVDAFCMTKDSRFKLIICGNGVLNDYISEHAKADNRIIFKGPVPRNEALALQKSSALLVNPRCPNGGITKYSFPSKTMEYLASGTPMLGYKLEGIPEEYFDYFFTMDELSTKSLASKIEYVLKLPVDELKEMGEKSKQFIFNMKNAKVQVGRIIKFIQQQ